ncbi:MAG: hypothetical protein KDB21_06170 [Acidimicrobiales bacterium]|nr:hypothetical protein [Acidimicrobiales bacterium]
MTYQTTTEDRVAIEVLIVPPEFDLDTTAADAASFEGTRLVAFYVSPAVGSGASASWDPLIGVATEAFWVGDDLSVVSVRWHERPCFTTLRAGREVDEINGRVETPYTPGTFFTEIADGGPAAGIIVNGVG